MTVVGVLAAGYFVSRAVLPDARGVARWGLTLVFGFCVIPLALFVAASIGGVPMDAPLLWIASAAINVTGAALAILPGGWRRSDVGLRDTGALAAAAALAAAFRVRGFRAIDGGDVLTTIQHCLYVIALHGVQNDPSWSLPLHDALTDDTIHFLIHHERGRLNGLAQLLYEQRLGNVPILAPHIALYGTTGWFICGVFALLVLGTCGWLAAREAGARPIPAALASALTVWGVQSFAMYYVNENVFAAAMVAFLLWGTLRSEGIPVSWAVVMGLVAGHLVGVRHTSALFLPALAVAVLWQAVPWRTRLIRLGAGLASTALAAAPWLYVNRIMLGSLFTHPKITPDSGGRAVQNAIFGRTFTFKPLNWPFTDRFVRTAWNPVPTILWIPLWTLQCFGQLTVAVAGFGLTRLPGRRAAWIVALFSLPHTLAIGWLEGVDWEQITYAAPGLVPLVVPLALGLGALAAPVRRLRRVAIVAGLSAALALAAKASIRLDLPADPRLLGPQAVAPGQTPGTRSVGDRLSRVSPLPLWPRWRIAGLHHVAAGLRQLVQSAPVPEEGGLPTYPSARVVVLSAYSSGVSRSYDFRIVPRPLRSPTEGVRSAVWLHTLAFRLRAAALRVHVERFEGRYRVDLVREGEAAVPQDFTFWLNPWFPPIQSIAVTLDGEPAPDLRRLSYGGSADDGEQLLLVTNYPPEVLDVVDVPYEVDVGGQVPGGCGIFIFLNGPDPTSIETLTPGGGHDQMWGGALRGTLRLPRHMVPDTVALFSEPYCSGHIPQYGDRFGVAHGPFGPDHPIRITLDGIW